MSAPTASLAENEMRDLLRSAEHHMVRPFGIMEELVEINPTILDARGMLAVCQSVAIGALAQAELASGLTAEDEEERRMVIGEV